MMESIFDSEIVKAWIYEIRTTGRIREIGGTDLTTRIASGLYGDEPEEAIVENLEPSRVIDMQSGLLSYEAFAVQSGVLRWLDILPRVGNSHISRYRCLRCVTHDEARTRAVLLFSFMVVKLHGRNMRDLIEAVEESRCAFIQEYDPCVFVPLEPSEPIVEKIEIITGWEDNK